MTLTLLGVALAGGLAGPTADAGVLELEYKTYRDFDLELPAERFLPVSGAIPIPHAGGEGFAARLEGTNLLVDTDGDGQTDVRLEGEDGLVTLRGRSSEGAELVYTARLVNQGKGWHYAASGARVGKLGKTRIRIVDQDGNGRYDDYGVDALIVGRGEIACWLSRAVHADGQLYSVEVAPDGSSLSYAPFADATGELDLRSELDTEGKLLSAVVKSLDGRYSFDLAKVRAGMAVPAGRYRIERGKIGLGEASVQIRSGRAKPIEVGAGATVEIPWGNPVSAEFDYARSGSRLAISPDDVRYFGVAGEEYTGWAPRGKSPEFLIKERQLGTELTKAIFPGSC